MLIFACVLAAPHIGLFSIPPIVVVIRSRSMQQTNYIVEVAVTGICSNRASPIGDLKEKSLASRPRTTRGFRRTPAETGIAAIGKSAAEPISITKWLLALALQLSQLDLLIQQ